ncbi:pentatricopeptide repeat-containing protein At4g19220, mitochondrial-like [Typha angustifolia]|uniref:pentatricopeptide repeat-containing protein At4g19220, mitochondrial-like n=1 Tax=Typha angustifolia TaxID=59011 RepID=UPI003C2FBD7A
MTWAELVFERMQNKDTSSWNCMINGSLLNGHAEGAFLYFREMIRSINRADEVSLSCVTSACSSLDCPFDFGELVHGWIIKLGYEGTCTSVPNSLISFYSQCGDVDAAEKVFIGFSEKNVVSWNAMINGLIENGRADEALLYFQKMQLTRAAQPDTLVTIIPVCGELNLLRQGKSLHGYTIRQELQSLDISVGNSLLGMYLECDDPTSADHLFRTMPSRDLISWNTMISGYSRTDSFKEESRVMFSELLRIGLRCSLASLLAILPSCTCPEDLIFGKAVHCLKLKYGFSSSVSAVNALMHMYMCCGDLRASLFLLKDFRPVSDVVSWNTIIVGCIQNGYLRDALQAFVSMRSSLLINPDAITFVNSLSACGNLKLLLFGRCMHGLAMKYLMLFNVRVRNALINMYFQCGDIKHAESVFHMNGDRNLCSWNCMISGFVQNEQGDRALETYRHMEDYFPNENSIVVRHSLCLFSIRIFLDTQVRDVEHRYTSISTFCRKIHCFQELHDISLLVSMGMVEKPLSFSGRCLIWVLKLLRALSLLFYQLAATLD